MNVACLTEFECAVYADGELPAHEARAVTEHLAMCASCRTVAESLRVESRVLVDCFQSTDFIEYELEDEALSASQAQNLGVMRFAAFVLAFSVLLRPLLVFMEELGISETLNGVIITAAYIVPAVISFVDSVLRNASWIAVGAMLFLGFILFSRRSHLASSLLSLAALLTVFSSPSYALDIRRGDPSITIPPGETVDDTLIVFGSTATIEGTVTGDVIALVGELTIRGRVKGNVISFARRVQVDGMVEGSTYGFAQSIETRGQIAHNAYAFAQAVDFGRDARIDENATIFAAQSNIEGNVGKDVYAGVASLNISSAAHIGGALTARVGRRENLQIAPGAVIAGKTDIQTPQPQPSRYSTVSFYVWQTIWLTAAFVTGLLLFWLVPAIAGARFETGRELLLAAGAGFIGLVATPVAALIAAITLIGLPLALIVCASWAVAIYLGKIVVAGFIGRSLLTRNGDTHPATALMLLAGLIPIFVATNLPYLGGLINLLLLILGLGLLVTRAYQMSRSSTVQAA